jgi:hypothetical protein
MNKEKCLSQHISVIHTAQTAAEEFFFIAAKTSKYVCYNSADNQ